MISYSNALDGLKEVYKTVIDKHGSNWHKCECGELNCSYVHTMPSARCLNECRLQLQEQLTAALNKLEQKSEVS